MRHPIVCFALLALLGAGCGSSSSTPVAMPTPPVEPGTAPAHKLPPAPDAADFVQVETQEQGSLVIIRGSTFSKRGFIVIALEESGKPGKILGTSDVQSVGAHGETWVNVSPALQESKAYYALLSHDNGDNRYDPAKDIRVAETDGVTRVRFTVTAPAAAAPSPISTEFVEIKNFAYSSATLTVKRGTKVTFTNKDAIGHTVTTDAKGFDSGLLTKDKTFTLDTSTLEPGSYPYHCTPHPNMKGTLIIN